MACCSIKKPDTESSLFLSDKDTTVFCFNDDSLKTATVGDNKYYFQKVIVFSDTVIINKNTIILINSIP